MTIPFSDEIAVSLDFFGERACFTALKLAERLSLPLAAGGCGADIEVVSLPELGERFEDGITPVSLPLDAAERDGGTSIRMPERSYGIGMFKAVLRVIWLCACRLALRRGLNGAVLHGALLDLPHGVSVVLFGQSGIGKSSAAARWRAAGGTCKADDLLLLFADGRGAIAARALPTWSRYPECCRYAEVHEVKALFRLRRGDGDEIVTADDEFFWRVALLNEIVMPHGGADFFTAGALTEIFDAGRAFAELLASRFGCHELMGDLRGNIFARVTEFLKR